MCALYKIYKRLQLLQDIKLLSRQSLYYFPHFITRWNWHQDISLCSMRQSETQNNNNLHGFILLYHVNVVGETILLFGTWQQEAPHQHKGQIKILLQRVLALTYGTKFRCFLKMQDNMCIQREKNVRAIKLLKILQRYICPLAQFRNEWDVSRRLLTSSKNLHLPCMAETDSPLQISSKYTNSTKV